MSHTQFERQFSMSMALAALALVYGAGCASSKPEQAQKESASMIAASSPGSPAGMAQRTLSSDRKTARLASRPTNTEAKGTQPTGDGPVGTPPGPPPDDEFGQQGPGEPPPGGFGGGPGEPPPGGFGGGPGGPPPGGFGGGPGGGARVTVKGAYTLTDGKTASESGKTFTSSEKDTGAVLVSNASTLTLVDPKVTTTGNTSSNDGSSFYGLNAAVLATSKSQIEIEGGSISSTGSGANGLFAYGTGTTATMRGGTIRTTKDGGHGVMAVGGGKVVLKDVDIYTSGIHGAALATDRGGGTVIVEGGKYVSAGQDSPPVYSTGIIQVSNAILSGPGSEAAVIEGTNLIDLKNCTLSGNLKWGVMVFQSFSGDAQGQQGRFKMSSGKLTALAGPLFYVTNTHGTITLDNVTLDGKSGVLLKASAGRWGSSGSNYGHAIINASHQTLTGTASVDSGSDALLNLTQGSSWTGSGDSISLTLDESSKWIVTADSSVRKLTVKSLSAIVSKGHVITYDAAQNRWLEGKTVKLADGGTLQPK